MVGMEYVRTYGLLVLSLVLAGAAWGSYAYGLSIVNTERASIIATQEAESQASTVMSAERATKALAHETEEGRAALAQIASGKDAIAVIGMLEELGRAAHTSLIVDSVGVDTSLKGSDLRAVNVSVHADGAFAQLFSLLTLLETMPAPGTVDALEFSKGDTAPWRLTVRSHILTKVD